MQVRSADLSLSPNQVTDSCTSHVLTCFQNQLQEYEQKQAPQELLCCTTEVIKNRVKSIGTSSTKFTRKYIAIPFKGHFFEVSMIFTNFNQLNKPSSVSYDKSKATKRCTSNRFTRASTSNVRLPESQRTPLSNSVQLPKTTRLQKKEDHHLFNY